MRIIHTADWHIGKILHKQELNEEINLFFDWLEQYISEQHVDLLLVSGDIFDMANPSNKDIKLYFNFLTRLSRTGVETVITGGNHDSVSLLNASSELLKELNIRVVGGVPENFDEQIIPIHDKNGKLCCVVLAVPFLRDRDLRLSVSADEAVDKMKIIPVAIKNHYDRLVATAKTQFKNAPIIGMGHLFMRGAMISDSEREIHVGNLQGMDGQMISREIDYMALGHIHKPQRIDKRDNMRYSGSPVYLDFSEAGYEKTVIEIEIDDNQLSIVPIKLPVFRTLLRLKGNMEEIQRQLDTFKNECALPAFVELEITEDEFSALALSSRQYLEAQFTSQYKVIKSKLTFASQVNTEAVGKIYETIDSLSPNQIFDIRLDLENMEEETRDTVKIAYNQILESLQN